MYGFVVQKINLPWPILTNAVGVAIFIVLTINIANMAYSVGRTCAEGSRRLAILVAVMSTDLILLSYILRPVVTHTIAQDVALNMIFPAMIAVTLLIFISRRANALYRDPFLEGYMRRHYGWVLELRAEREREFRKSFREMREVPVKRFVYPRS